MKCVICKHGATQSGTATVTLERKRITVVFKSVPASVCENCGEEYINEEISSQLLSAFEEAIRSGVLVDVREFAASGKT